MSGVGLGVECWGKRNITKRQTLHHGLEKLLMTENNFLSLIQQMKPFLKK